MLPDNIIVIIPLYNREKTIVRCLRSIKIAYNMLPPHEAQTSLNVIVVDDGSTDLSLSMVKKFFLHNSEINHYIIRTKHEGAAAKRNIGIKKALETFPDKSGLLFIDSDDELKQDFFKLLSLYWDSNSIISFDLRSSKRVDVFSENSLKFCKRFFKTGKKHINCALWNRVYPLRHWNKHEIPKITYFEDLSALLTLFDNEKKIIFVRGYNGYILHKDVPGLTRRPFDDDCCFDWLISIGYLSKIIIHKNIKKRLISYLYGFFLEIYPRYHYGKNQKKDKMVDESICILLLRKTIFYYHPKRINDLIKKIFFILFGHTKYTLIYRKIVGI